MRANGHNNVILTIDQQACYGCRRCLGARVCPSKAIRSIDPGEAPYIDVDLCRECMVCIPACPSGAIIRHDHQR